MPLWQYEMPEISMVRDFFSTIPGGRTEEQSKQSLAVT